MHIVLLCIGTRGDVQPFVALARGLQRAGHRVTLAAGEEFRQFVEQSDIVYRPLRVNLAELIRSEGWRDFLSAGLQKKIKLFRQQFAPIVERTLVDCWHAVQGADAIVFHPSAAAGPHLAEKLNVPVFAALAVPGLSPTGHFANPNCAPLSFGRYLNRLTYSRQTPFYSHFAAAINRWRAEVLGLPQRAKNESDLVVAGARIPVLYSYSPCVLPCPDDWDDTAHVTGYWFLGEQDWHPPAELSAFIEAGDPPIYVGFGSMVGPEPEEFTKTVLQAIRLSGQRAVLATGWGGLTAQTARSERLFMVDALPHEWLFPQVAAVVHHGGSGTTAASLRAGRPSVICPLMLDQPFWGHVVHKLGVGTRPIPQRRLSARLLARALQQAVSDQQMQRRAREVAAQLRAENGVARAIKVIDDICSRWPSPGYLQH